MPIGAWAQTSTIDLSTLTATYVISDNEEYTFTGTGNYGIKVESGNPRIILNNVSITVGKEWDNENIVNAIDIVADNSETTVWITGTNNLTSNSGAGIYVKSGSTVIIKSDSRDNILTARAGMDGAGIGGTGYDFSYENVTCGNIYIENVTVNAYSSGYMSSNPGIGAFTSCGTITIKNATVTALGGNQGGVLYGGEFCSAIGASTVPDIVIENSTINAYREDSKDSGTGSLADWIGAVIIYDPYSGDTPHTPGIQCGNGYIISTTVNKFLYKASSGVTKEEGSVKYGALGSLLVEDENGNWVCEGEHTYANGVCANCGYKCTHEGGEHTTAIDNGDGTHSFTCSICGEVTEEHSTEKNKNKATCQHGNICDLCGAEYSEPDPDAHSYNEDGFCEMCSTANPDETMFFIFDGDHKAFNVAEDLVGVNIEYTRGLHNTEWNSLYLPFEVPVTEELLDEFEFAYVNDMHSADTDDNGEIDEIEMEIVKIKEGTLHANHPYFIRAKSEYTILQLSYENTTLHATEETTLNCSSIYMDYAIVGSYKHIKGTEFASMPADRYYAISIDGGWWQIPEDSSLYPFRAYLSMTARDGSPVKVSDEAMRSIRIREKGEGTTDIEEVKGENGEVNSEIYDLSGRRVMQPQKGGVYIVGGKKIVY